MTRKAEGWKGSRVEDFLTDQMRNPAFRMAFSAARAQRIKRALAETIQNFREARGLSQAAVAKRAKTTQAVVSRIENPAVRYLPSIEVLARLAVALGANLEIALVPSSRTAA